QSIEDAVQGFTQLEQIFYDRRDRRAIFVAELQPIQDLLAQKYCQFFKFLEVIGGQLEQMVANFAYTRAQNGAWETELGLDFLRECVLTWGYVYPSSIRKTRWSVCQDAPKMGSDGSFACETNDH